MRATRWLSSKDLGGQIFLCKGFGSFEQYDICDRVRKRRRVRWDLKNQRSNLRCSRKHFIGDSGRVGSAAEEPVCLPRSHSLNELNGQTRRIFCRVQITGMPWVSLSWKCPSLHLAGSPALTLRAPTGQ